MSLLIEQAPTFVAWLADLRDGRGKAFIVERLRRLSGGNFGDAKALGDGVWEMRIHSGPGYRVYYVRRGERVVIILCGGDKSSQQRDIAKAKLLAEET